jgi:hypothetical protein
MMMAPDDGEEGQLSPQSGHYVESGIIDMNHTRRNNATAAAATASKAAAGGGRPTRRAAFSTLPTTSPTHHDDDNDNDNNDDDDTKDTMDDRFISTDGISSIGKLSDSNDIDTVTGATGTGTGEATPSFWHSFSTGQWLAFSYIGAESRRSPRSVAIGTFTVFLVVAVAR